MTKSKNDFIYSQERQGHWIPLAIGLICILIASPGYRELLPAWHRGDYLPVAALLLFPMVGVGMLYAAFQSWRHYRFFGPSPLRLDPSVGQSGGQVGGEIMLNHYWRHDASFNARLICLMRRRDRRSEVEPERLVWETAQTPYGESRPRGTSLRFCFDVPASAPATSEDGTTRIYWNLILEGDVAGRHLSRSWLVPVEKGTARCRQPLPEAHIAADQRQRALNALKVAIKQISIEPHGNGVRLISRAGRNLAMNIGLMLFGSLFTGGAAWLVMDSSRGSGIEYMGYFMALVFGGIGLTAVGAALWMLGRSLHVEISEGRIISQRRWLGFPIGQPKTGELRRASQIGLTSNSSTGHGEDTVEMMNLIARDDGARIRLAESIAGRETGEALKLALIEGLALP